MQNACEMQCKTSITMPMSINHISIIIRRAYSFEQIYYKGHMAAKQRNHISNHTNHTPGMTAIKKQMNMTTGPTSLI